MACVRLPNIMAGGPDNWLTKTKDEKLSLKARRLKREIVKKQASAAA